MKKKENLLKKYKNKRDFTTTPEPSSNTGVKNKQKEGNIFVVQQHNATTMHYDFRIQIDGVLKSWAVPKGPSMDPHDKRLAIETEDHPLRYATFEGVIPRGNYGAGAVIVWDKGTYINLKNALSMQESFNQGEITVWLEGDKLTGGFALIHTKLGSGKSWILVKMRDKEAQDGSHVTKDRPNSVQSNIPITLMKTTKGK
jgi:DNA ligase D-like protein (predicted 3'-phosphoesterase)